MSERYSSHSDTDIRGVIFSALRDIWIPVIVAIAVSMLSGTVAENFLKKEYTSSTTVAVMSKNSTDSAYSLLDQNYGTADTLSRIITSSTMKKLIAEDLNVKTVDAEINATLVSSTNIICISVTSSSPRTSYLVIKSLMKNYPAISEYIINNSFLEVLEEPELPYGVSNGVNIPALKKTVFTITFFIVLFLLVAFILNSGYVRTEDDVRSKLDTRLFASIPHERKYLTVKDFVFRRARRAVISSVRSGRHFVEAFYKLRTKLEYAMEKQNRKILLVTSTLENEGKSSVSLNIALSLASGGKKVLLVDCDLRNPSQHKLLNKKPADGKEFTDYLNGKCTAEEAVLLYKRFNLNVVMSEKPVANSVELLSQSTLPELLQKYRDTMDYIILDTSPMLITADAEYLSRFADAALLVVRRERASAAVINDMVDILGNNTELLGCVFNDVYDFDALKQSAAKGLGMGSFYGDKSASELYEKQDS